VYLKLMLLPFQSLWISWSNNSAPVFLACRFNIHCISVDTCNYLGMSTECSDCHIVSATKTQIKKSHSFNHQGKTNIAFGLP